MNVLHLVPYTALLSVALCATLHALSDEFIQLINQDGNWKAGRNFHPDMTKAELQRLGSVEMDIVEYKKLPLKTHHPSVYGDLPESFDPRDKWPHCPTLNEIRDQGRCGACWAFGAVEAMTDRVCIQSNGTKNFHFSAQDLVTCNEGHSGCDGGSSLAAWGEWVEYGISSGGNYGSHQGCKPYSFPPCENHLRNCTNFLPTPKCTDTCEDGYKTSYKRDKKRGKDMYYMSGEAAIMAELYEKGPVEAAFFVYEDFADYKGGVYEHKHGEFIFGHAVKLLGWGVEGGKKYWLAANSWGAGFGENGFFKILRGEDHCWIESFVVAGDPLLEDY